MPRALLVALLFTATAIAQQRGPCTEEAIHQTLVDTQGNPTGKNLPSLAAKDIYFYSHALDSPAIGKDDVAKKLSAVPVERQRANVKQGPEHADNIVADAAGTMAYEYGTTEISWDRTDTGEHVDFKPWYLRVWKEEGGVCKVAAVMYQPPRGAPVRN